jgi:hypothetical protein
MSAPDGWELLQQCLQLTEQLDVSLARPQLGLQEIAHLEQLYAQRQQLLEALQQWWETLPPEWWTAEKARKWLDTSRQLLERSTRQRELLRSLVAQWEKRLQAAVMQRSIVRYHEGSDHGY